MTSDEDAKSREMSPTQNDTNGKVLILLENGDQVRDCISWFDNIRSEKQIIALTPFAMYELDKNGLSYKIPGDYHYQEELFQIGNDNFDKIENLCNLIDSEIQLNSNEFSKLNIKPALFSFYHLKIMYDTLTIRIFQISKIFDNEKPYAVYFYDSAKYPFGADGSAPYLQFNHKESLYAQLLILNGWGISQKRLPSIPQDIDKQSNLQKESAQNKLKEKVKKYLSGHPELYDIALITRNKGLPGFVQWLNNSLHTRKEFPVLLYGGGYNWDDCSEDLRMEGIAPIYRIEDNFHWLNEAIENNSEYMHTIWLNLQENPEFKSFFIMNGIDFYPIVKDRLEFLIKKMSLACLMSVKHIMDLIVKKNIKAVIASTLATCVGHSAARAAHNLKIPVITWQHGGYGSMEIHPMVNYCDLISSDAHFVFGDGVIDSYLQASRKYGTELVAVGSTSLESIYDKETNKVTTANEDTRLNNGKKILYVTSSYSQNDFNISVFPSFTDNLFWETQKSIIDILGQHDNHKVTVKLHPSNNHDIPPLQPYSVDCGYNNLKFIKQEESFTELLQKADAVIIDFPFTTLLQVLTTKKAVFAYTGFVFYNERAQRLLSKRAICSRNLDEFLSKLGNYLSKNIYEADFNNNEFLETYGITSSKGTSKKIAPRELRKILDRVNKSRELTEKKNK